MALTAEAQRLLDRFKEVGVRPYDELTVLEARAMVDASVGLQVPPPEIGSVTDLLAPGGDGMVPVRVYRPAGQSGPRPLVVYFHGGGWVTGSVEVADRPCRALAADSGCVVASVEYRRSPESKFPAPTEDCFAATAWLAENAAGLGADPTRLAVCGDSAGGNLAVATALLARERGGPEIALQLPLYATLASPGSGEYASHRENGEGYGLTLGGIEWFWCNYLRGPEDGRDPHAAPLLADLTGLPPALVVTAEFDVLRDESIAYAERLRAAAVPAELEIVPGVIHGFFWMDRYFEEAAALRRLVGERMEAL